MFLTGLICFSIMVVAAVCSGYSIDGSIYFWDVLTLLGLKELSIAFIILGGIGVILAIAVSICD